MLKVINKLKAPCAILLLAAGCSYVNWMDAASAGSVEREKKVCFDSEFSKSAFTIEADIGQFSKDDLRPVPFGTNRRSDGEEVYFLVNKETQLPIGLISFLVEDFDYSASIEKLGIQEKFQKRGHGKTLLNHALKTLKSRGIKKVDLVSTREGRDFYRKNGFTIGATGYLERSL